VNLAAAKEWFDPNVYALGQYKQKTYGLSYRAGDFCVLYNKQHFKEAGLDPQKGPATIAELDSYAEKLTRRGPGGRIDRMGFLPNSDENQFWLFGTVFGGKFYDAQSQKVTADDPNLVRALEWFQSYPKKYGSKKVAAFQSGLSSERAQNLDPFIAGKLSLDSSASDFPELPQCLQRGSPASIWKKHACCHDTQRPRGAMFKHARRVRILPHPMALSGVLLHHHSGDAYASVSGHDGTFVYYVFKAALDEHFLASHRSLLLRQCLLHLPSAPVLLGDPA
jgi:Bacterial extracellular solute-binding protein